MATRTNNESGIQRRRWTEPGLYALAVVVVVLFSGSLMLSVERISDSRAAIYASRTTGSWVAFSTELEFRRFMETLGRYALGEPEVTRETLDRRFDIFWSRIPLLVTGPDAERLKLAPQTVDLERDLMDAMRRVEPLVAALEPEDRDGYRKIRATLDPFGARLRDLLITVEIDLKQNFQQEVVDLSHRQVFLSFLGVLFGGGAVILLLFTQLRRAARLSEERRRAQAEADAANRAKSEFLARMTHELRTPLSAVIGYSELMQEEAAERGYTEMLDDLERVRVAANHLLAMINDTLDLAKIEAGRLEFYPEPVNLGRLVREVVEAVKPLALRNRNRLETDLADVGPAETDPTKLRQVLFNLLSNASKFTENGVISLTMRSETARNTPMICFQVRDTGPGIPESDQEQIFQPFFRLGDSGTRSISGTGLGLSVAQSICKLMGGSIELESGVEGGATFTVRLPARLPTAAPGDDSPPIREAV